MNMTVNFVPQKSSVCSCFSLYVVPAQSRSSNDIQGIRSYYWLTSLIINLLAKCKLCSETVEINGFYLSKKDLICYINNSNVAYILDESAHAELIKTTYQAAFFQKNNYQPSLKILSDPSFVLTVKEERSDKATQGSSEKPNQFTSKLEVQEKPKENEPDWQKFLKMLTPYRNKHGTRIVGLPIGLMKLLKIERPPLIPPHIYDEKFKTYEEWAEHRLIHIILQKEWTCKTVDLKDGKKLYLSNPEKLNITVTIETDKISGKYVLSYGHNIKIP
jgi:hypothetical protein